MSSSVASNASKTVAITGANSFTGLWIARAFAEAGWKVYGLTGSDSSAYSGLKKTRTEELKKVADFQDGISAENSEMEDWIRKHRPAIWVHHHHFMENYRSPKYDLARARSVALDPLPGIADALGASGCSGVIYTGTFFEPGEGGRPPTDPSTPYGSSKAETWAALKMECDRVGVPVSKVISPNPIGPFENEDRIIQLVLDSARQGKPFALQNPGSKSDYLPVDILASVYLRAAKSLLNGKAQIFRPSGHTASLREWIDDTCRELIVTRLGLKAPKIEQAASASPAAGVSAPLSFENPPSERIQIRWEQFWDSYADYEKKKKR